MRPKSTTADLLSSYKVKENLHNLFVKHMKTVKEEIIVRFSIYHCLCALTATSQAAPRKVSVTMDGWSADTTKMAFQGMTAHWIEVKEGKWRMRASVIRFKGVLGDHSGENLGRYAVGLLDRVGIMDKKESKVSTSP